MTASGTDEKKVMIIANNIECERHVQFFSNVEKYFKLNGWRLLDSQDSPERADKIVIAACGYHKIMYDRVIGAIEALREKKYTDQDMIVAGCLPKTFEEQLKSLFTGGLVEYRKAELFDSMIEPKVAFRDIGLTNVFNVWGKSQELRNKMFYIKTADGCLGHCTYCAIKKAKGHLTSLTKEAVLEQYLKAVKAGHRRIFLMGDDAFAYGLDIQTNMVELVRYLLAHHSEVELYFGALDIKWLKKYFEDIYVWVKEGKIKKLDFGIQHIRDSVLKRMGRETGFVQAYELIKKLKAANPSLYLTGDILVGFPGETQEDFEALLEFFRQDRCFDSLKHYGFSEIDGTPAYLLPADLKVHPLHIARRWQLFKDALAERSQYNTVSDPDSQGEAFQRTMAEEVVLCKDSYVEIM